MPRRQKINELYFGQINQTLKDIQHQGLGNKNKFGQSFRCFGLGKSKTEQQISRKQSLSTDKFGEIPVPTRKSVQQLTKLINFYQSEKNKRNLNRSQKVLYRKKSLNLPFQMVTQKKSFYGIRQSPRVQYHFLNKTPRPIVQQISIGSFDKKIQVQNSRREIQSQRKSIQKMEQAQIQRIKRKSFIPAPKLKSSPKKFFLK